MLHQCFRTYLEIKSQKHYEFGKTIIHDYHDVLGGCSTERERR